MKESMGVILVLAGLILIYVQLALQIGWIEKKTTQQQSGLEATPESAVKFLDKLLDNAGWMVVVGLILIYFGIRCLDVSAFGMGTKHTV